ncbi:aminoglycoside adenylyltransferase family protein [Paracidovorax citrulli]
MARAPEDWTLPAGTPPAALLDVPAQRQVEEVVLAAQRHLGPTLLAAWLYGSAMDGGLRRHSDIDLLLLTSEPLTDRSRAALTADLLRLSGVPGDAGRRPLELTIVELAQVKPWRHPAMREYQFGEWLRADLLQGAAIEPERDPDLALLLTKARQHSLALVGPHAADRLDAVPPHDVLRAMQQMLPELAQNWREDARNAVLTLCRMLVTAATGSIVRKDVAAQWVLDHCPGPYCALARWARSAYLGEPDAAAPDHGDEADAAVAALARLAQAHIAAGLQPNSP